MGKSRRVYDLQYALNCKC